MINARVVYISYRLECIDSVLPKIRFSPRAVRFPVVVEMSQPPPDFVLVIVPLVAISRVRLVSNSVAIEFV